MQTLIKVIRLAAVAVAELLLLLLLLWQWQLLPQINISYTRENPSNLQLLIADFRDTFA